MKRYLIRHGKTEANERHLYCGSTDLPLSPAGREGLSGLHYDLPPVRFFTSGMLRTEQTLYCLFGDVPYEILPEFREIDFGIFEMHSYMELRENPQYQAWITGDNDRNIPPEGESGEAMVKRVLAAYDALPEENVAVITHGGVIAAIMEARFPEEGKNRYEWQPAPGYGYVLTENSWSPIP